MSSFTLWFPHTLWRYTSTFELLVNPFKINWDCCNTTLFSSIKSAAGISVGTGQVVPFKTSNNGDKLAMDSNVANVIDATAGKVKSKNATGAGSSKGMGIDNTPNIESSNPNDNSSIIAEATFNIA